MKEGRQIELSQLSFRQADKLAEVQGVKTDPFDMALEKRLDLPHPSNESRKLLKALRAPVQWKSVQKIQHQFFSRLCADVTMRTMQRSQQLQRAFQVQPALRRMPEIREAMGRSRSKKPLE